MPVTITNITEPSGELRHELTIEAVVNPISVDIITMATPPAADDIIGSSIYGNPYSLTERTNGAGDKAVLKKSGDYWQLLYPIINAP